MGIINKNIKRAISKTEQELDDKIIKSKKGKNIITKLKR